MLMVMGCIAIVRNAAVEPAARVDFTRFLYWVIICARAHDPTIRRRETFLIAQTH